MKKNIPSKSLLLVLATITCVNANSQPAKLCGDYKIDRNALAKAREYEKNNAGRLQTTNYLIRIYFHIGAYSDGTNPVTTVSQLEDEFSTLVADYTADNICFLNAGFDFINNSNLDTNFNASTGDPSVFDPFRIPQCLNVFYLQKIKGSNPACANTCGIGGTSLQIPNTFCLIAGSNIGGGGRTISHEIAHCLGLLHTFEKNVGGLEKIDGSNSTTAGDQIADTPADPYVFVGNSCYSLNGCNYSGNCADPNGATNYSPPYNNLMAYWWAAAAGCIPSQLFLTPDQYTRANSFLNTNIPLVGCESPNTLMVAGVNRFGGYYMASAIDNLYTYGDVNISGTTIATMGSAIVQLEAGFHATPSAGGKIIIRSTPCNQ